MQKIWSVLAAMLVLVCTINLSKAGPALLLDAKTSKVFYAEDADHPWHPASTTKLMTAYLAFEAIKEGRLKLNDAVIQTERTIKEPPSKIGLPVGLGMTVDLGLQALIVKSANDVAAMFAEKIGGSVEGFVAMMNRKAKQLGMTSTSFVNPHGLHNPGQITTARDLATLTLALLRDFPQHQARFTHSHVRIGKRRLRSYNSLLRTYEGADGMKTGFICASGYNVVASATRNGRKLIAVVLGAKNGQQRAQRAAALLTYGFQYFDWKMLMKGNDSAPLLTSMPAGPFHNAAPSNLRPVVCRPRRVVRKKRLRKRKYIKRRASKKRRKKKKRQ